MARVTRPHVLLVHDAYTDYVASLANALANRTTVTVLHNARSNRYMSSVLSERVRRSVYRYRRIRDPRRWIAVPPVGRAAAQLDIDIVHLQQSNDPWFNVRQLTSVCRKPQVLTVHDIRPHPGDGSHVPGGHVTLRVQRRRFGRFIVHSPALREDLAATWRLPLDRICVLPHGELGSLYGGAAGADRAVPPGGRRVLFFGRIWPYKGLDRLVRAMSLLAATRPGLTLTIAGRGEDLRGYLALARPPLTVEVVDRFVPREEVGSLFAGSDVACLPYLEASQSGVHALACGMGVPVVATRVGGLVSAIQDGADGLLVPTDDVPALAEALGRILDDPGLRSRLARGAARRARSELSWDEIAEQTLTVYAQVLGEPCTV